MQATLKLSHFFSLKNVINIYLKIRDLDKYKENKIKVIVNSKKKYIVVLIYYIL